jgi:hypothetical protein
MPLTKLQFDSSSYGYMDFLFLDFIWFHFLNSHGDPIKLLHLLEVVDKKRNMNGELYTFPCIDTLLSLSVSW